MKIQISSGEKNMAGLKSSKCSLSSSVLAFELLMSCGKIFFLIGTGCLGTASRLSQGA